MVSRMELFEQIKRDRDREGLSVRALAERHGVHRRAVRQALVSPVPPVKRAPLCRPAPKLGAYRALIDAWLEADCEAPRKQRHTAKRIWSRLVDEHGADVAESTVREYVRQRKRAMGWPVGEVFVPQVHAPGVGAEVDWGEAQVELAGARTKVQLFLMRASFSGASFCQASLVGTQQAFLELHVEAFEWFGGVFAEIRFDNLTSAVKQVLRGRRRVETDRFVALRSHYLFESQFTTPGIVGAHEKGGVEGEVGRFRRNHLVPVPGVASLAELNTLILAGCEADLGRRIVGRSLTVGGAWATERPLLRGLPSERFDASETATPRVDAKSLVTIRQNRYSVPVALAGLRVAARIGAREITISHAGKLVARHERLHGRFGTSAQLDHYLELLQQRLAGLGYASLGADGTYGQDTLDAVMAFQKVEGLPRTGHADANLWTRLAHAIVPRPRYGGDDHIEVDKARQVLFLVRAGRVASIVPVSTAGLAGYYTPAVPAYPASHGCVRVPMWISWRLYSTIPYGEPVYVYS